MDINMMAQIQRIVDMQVDNLSRARDLYSNIKSMDVERAKTENAVVLKKADDSTASLSHIYRFLKYDNYDSSMSSFFKNAEYVSDTIPQFVQPASSMNFDVYFRNKGVFYSWTDDKSIYMKTVIKRVDGSLYHDELTNLDLSIPENAPGESLKNEDYDKQKIFKATIEVDFPVGLYFFTLSLSDAANGDYNAIYSKQVIVR